MTATIEDALRKQQGGDYNGAIYILERLLEENQYDIKANSLIGIILVNNTNYSKSLIFLLRAIELKSTSELVYLSTYLAYVGLKEFSKAIDVLNSYLSQHPANLFKDTLEELLYDLSNGYALDFQDTIHKLAKKNNIPFVPIKR